jgi:hypothetical protein
MYFNWVSASLAWGAGLGGAVAGLLVGARIARKGRFYRA